MTSRAVSALAVAALLLVARSAGASSGKALSLSELYCEADLVVYGIVADQREESGWRLSEIEPLVIAKGASTGAIVERSHAALHGDHPDYRSGQVVIAFLTAVPGDDSYRTVGMRQGKYEVVDGRVTRGDRDVGELLDEIGRIHCEAAAEPSADRP